jgi:hypothetical protein
MFASEGGEVRGVPPPRPALPPSLPRVPLRTWPLRSGRWLPAVDSSERLGEGRRSESHWWSLEHTG